MVQLMISITILVVPTQIYNKGCKKGIIWQDPFFELCQHIHPAPCFTSHDGVYTSVPLPVLGHCFSRTLLQQNKNILSSAVNKNVTDHGGRNLLSSIALPPSLLKRTFHHGATHQYIAPYMPTNSVAQPNLFLSYPRNDSLICMPALRVASQ